MAGERFRCGETAAPGGANAVGLGGDSPDSDPDSDQPRPRPEDGRRGFERKRHRGRFTPARQRDARPIASTSLLMSRRVTPSRRIIIRTMGSLSTSLSEGSPVGTSLWRARA